MRRRFTLFLVLSLLGGTSTGCGLMDGAQSDAASNGQVEKSLIKVGRLALVDALPVHVALDRGYFKQEGLDVELSTMAKGSDSVDRLMAGELDIGLTSYPQPLIAQARGVAKLKVVADAVETTPDLIVAVVKVDGPITDPRQLSGQKVAISSKRGISELVMTDQLTGMGVDPRTVSFLSMPITDMPAALNRGDIAAAVIAQPPLEEAKQQGAVKLLDPFTGPTASFPWAGWFGTEEFVRDNPKTVDAFRRALNRGVVDVADRNVLEQSAVKNLGIKDSTAKLMTIPNYPTTADPVRLQRVADLLQKYGEIPRPLDMKSMVLPGLPPASGTTSTGR